MSLRGALLLFTTKQSLSMRRLLRRRGVCTEPVEVILLATTYGKKQRTRNSCPLFLFPHQRIKFGEIHAGGKIETHRGDRYHPLLSQDKHICILGLVIKDPRLAVTN